MQSRGGFTLIEIMVTLVIGLILFSIGAVISVNFIRNREIDLATETLVSYLRAAEQRALASEGNTNHGVSVADNKLTFFRGTSFAARQVAYDTIFPYQSYLVFSGITEVVFAKQTGAPSVTGTMTVNNGIRSETITIYSTGAISR